MSQFWVSFESVLSQFVSSDEKDVEDFETLQLNILKSWRSFSPISVSFYSPQYQWLKCSFCEKISIFLLIHTLWTRAICKIFKFCIFKSQGLTEPIFNLTCRRLDGSVIQGSSAKFLLWKFEIFIWTFNFCFFGGRFFETWFCSDFSWLDVIFFWV